MLEAVISITPPHSWIRRVTAEFPSVIRVLDCRSLPDGEGVQELFEVTSAADLSDKIVSYLRQDSYVYDIDIVRADQGRVIGSLKTTGVQHVRPLPGQIVFSSPPRANPTGNWNGLF